MNATPLTVSHLNAIAEAKRRNALDAQWRITQSKQYRAALRKAGVK
jgi:hypothetical protein